MLLCLFGGGVGGLGCRTRTHEWLLERRCALVEGDEPSVIVTSELAVSPVQAGGACGGGF